ncbi:chemoreceptor glutamine deamidase CheD [Methyloradius palustris]|uniref:Probable chemoreceptor glutamine deamidase CheD n=1 Tax=Methyloradius palustris TaxID=2778876 RepID=A0A8D5JVK7_9PROT|nr:chemoreceptor glutamine deamidase CheD [Methyloradius palustris]BCM24224.1 putative chemoreceptor glutamine deamidase CheD 1 [Methyloradius palustris]
MTAHANKDITRPNVYFDSRFGLDAAKILPGQYYATQRNMLLVTVTGACITACIRDKVSGIGGMNNYMLPDEDTVNFKSEVYGIKAMDTLINDLIQMGAAPENLEAKVFGASNMLNDAQSIAAAARNTQFVFDYLKTRNIQVVATDVQDVYPRKIYFFVNTGKVMVKKLRNMHNETIINRESEYTQRFALAQFNRAEHLLAHTPSQHEVFDIQFDTIDAEVM